MINFKMVSELVRALQLMKWLLELEPLMHEEA